MSRNGVLSFGEPAPWFVARCTSSPEFHFDSVAGRYVVLCFFGSLSRPASRQALSDFLERRAIFDDVNVLFFGVSNDPDDERLQRVNEILPGMRYFWDFDRTLLKLYGANSDGSNGTITHTLVLDERLRTLAVLPLDGQPGHAAQVIAFLKALPPLGPPSRATIQAPVLVVPRIFEPRLCRMVIDYYDRHGGQESGVMREVDGRTVPISDSTFKRRRDQEIVDETLREACMVRIHNRLVPEIAKAFQFQVTRMERYIIACYEAKDRGFFRAHRDNTTKGTAHRRFAVSLNLNTGEYEGGMLCFPEYGPKYFVPPTGGALVFSCSLLHEATPVTHGRRYAFLPFLYDDAAAKTRELNQPFVAMNGSATQPGNSG